MQNLDPSREYTDDEVKSALSGADGARDWSFRYERLDKDNFFIEDIDFVDSCSIDNNIFADIKRSAKFRLMDKGNINYLQDRIKPYARLNMPQDESYGNFARSLVPDVHYVMNDPIQVPLVPTFVAVPESNAHNTFATAFVMSKGNAIYPRLMPSSTTVRKTLWVQFTTTPIDAINIIAGMNETGNRLTVYTLPDNGGAQTQTEADLVEVGVFPAGQIWSMNKPFPEPETYYLKYEALTATEYAFAEWGRPIRIFDSSGKGRHANAVNVTPVTGIVRDGGTAQKVTGNIIRPAGGDAISSSQYFSGAFWIDMDNPGGTNMAVLCESSNSFLQIAVNAAIGRITITTGLGGWATGVDFVKDFPVGAERDSLYRAKHIAWTVDLDKAVGTLWIDGKEYTLNGVRGWGSFDPVYISDATIQNIIVSNLTNETVPYVIDDLEIFFNKMLKDAEISTLYRLGNTSYRSRKGYVEWPQGVFLLSSPSRVLEEGTSAYREVEAYDQLLTLREDSYETRYTAPKGANCVNEVEKILGYAKRVMLAPLTISGTSNIGAITDPGYNTPGSANATNDVSISVEQRPGSKIDRELLPVGSARGAVSQKLSYNSTSAFTVNKSLLGTTLVLDKVATFSAWMKPSVDVTVTTTIGSTTKTHALRANTWTNLLHTGRTSNQAGTAGMLYPAAIISIALPAGAHNIITAEAFVEEGETAGEFFMPRLPSSTQYSYGFEQVQGYPGPYFDSHAVAYSKMARITPSNQTFTEALEWEPGTTKLQVINDILAYINYDSAYFDENGIFVAEPYLSPAQRGSEFTYATDANSMITSDNVSQTLDVFSIPNKWVLVVSEPDSPPMIGSYTNDDPMSPTSTVARGRTIVDYRTEENASDQATLNAKAARLAFEASQVYEKIEFSTGLMPIHGNGDTYDIIIDELAIRNKYNETAWSMELEAGSTMKHQVRKIVQV